MKLTATEYINKAEELKLSERNIRRSLESIRMRIEKVRGDIRTQEERLQGLFSDLASLQKHGSDGTLNDSEYESTNNDRECIEVQIQVVRNLIDDNKKEESSLRREEIEAYEVLCKIEEDENTTLVEIQDAANRTNNNISLISSFGGDYAGISEHTSSAFQENLSKLSRAAQILGQNITTNGIGITGTLSHAIITQNSLRRQSDSNKIFPFAVAIRGGSNNRNFYEAASNECNAKCKNRESLGAKPINTSLVQNESNIYEPKNVRDGSTLISESSPDAFIAEKQTNESSPFNSDFQKKMGELRVNPNQALHTIDRASLISRINRDVTITPIPSSKIDSKASSTERALELKQQNADLRRQFLDSAKAKGYLQEEMIYSVLHDKFEHSYSQIVVTHKDGTTTIIDSAYGSAKENMLIGNTVIHKGDNLFVETKAGDSNYLAHQVKHISTQLKGMSINNLDAKSRDKLTDMGLDGQSHSVLVVTADYYNMSQSSSLGSRGSKGNLDSAVDAQNASTVVLPYYAHDLTYTMMHMNIKDSELSNCSDQSSKVSTSIATSKTKSVGGENTSSTFNTGNESGSGTANFHSASGSTSTGSLSSTGTSGSSSGAGNGSGSGGGSSGGSQ